MKTTSKPSEKKQTRVIGYVRVSTFEQASEGYSLAAQTERLKSYAKLYGLTLVGVLEEQGSGKDLNRPQLQQALGMLATGKADALLVAKLDRLTRSVKDLGELIEKHFGEGKAALLSVADSIDTRSASGRLILNVLGSVAQWERETISERTAQAKAEMRAQGIFQGGAVPFGYSVNEDATLTAIPEEQATIERAKALKAEGLPLRTIAARLASEGRLARNGRPFAAQQVANMLKGSVDNAHEKAEPKASREVVLEAVRALTPMFRAGLVPIWKLRTTLDLSKAELDETLLKLRQENALTLKMMNDPQFPEVIEAGGTEQGIDQRPKWDAVAGKRVGFDGTLLWYAVLC